MHAIPLRVAPMPAVRYDLNGGLPTCIRLIIYQEYMVIVYCCVLFVNLIWYLYLFWLNKHSLSLRVWVWVAQTPLPQPCSWDYRKRVLAKCHCYKFMKSCRENVSLGPRLMCSECLFQSLQWSHYPEHVPYSVTVVVVKMVRGIR